MSSPYTNVFVVARNHYSCDESRDQVSLVRETYIVAVFLMGKSGGGSL